MLIHNSSQNNAVLNNRGAFIVMEGVDRCGKTTQCGLLLKHLLSIGVAAAAMRFPDRTTSIGQLIHQYLTGDQELDDRAVHLLFSANRWEGAPQLEQTLFHEGKTVICDRYAYSGVAFTSAKPRDGKGGPLDLEWCKRPDVGLPAPDAVIFLDLSQEEAEQRGG
jgi:dTMP kinase